jgi:hypothetical protein
MLYTHKKLHYSVTVTAEQGKWLEFYTHDTGELRWLEREVFLTGYQLVDLDIQRKNARSRGILVPYEFLSH